jgi:hypothetical protein
VPKGFPFDSKQDYFAIFDPHESFTEMSCNISFRKECCENNSRNRNRINHVISVVCNLLKDGEIKIEISCRCANARRFAEFFRNLQSHCEIKHFQPSKTVKSRLQSVEISPRKAILPPPFRGNTRPDVTEIL